MCPEYSHNLLIDFLVLTKVNFNAETYTLDSKEKCICVAGYYGSASSRGCKLCPLGGRCCVCDRTDNVSALASANGSHPLQRECSCIAGASSPIAIEERSFVFLQLAVRALPSAFDFSLSSFSAPRIAVQQRPHAHGN